MNAFRYCLQSISKKGHHREIANRINQSDYFGVFNSMLASELAIAGKIAVDGFSEEVSASIDKNKGQMGSLVKDLRRTCTSTSYTYLYAMEVGYVVVVVCLKSFGCCLYSFVTVSVSSYFK